MGMIECFDGTKPVKSTPINAGPTKTNGSGMIEKVSEFEETKSRYELKHEHGPKGGYVLYDDEFDRYKGWLSTLMAASEFEAAFPEFATNIKYTTSEFSKFLVERETFVEELKRFQPGAINEMSSSEIREFAEFLHADLETVVETGS